MIVRPNQDGFSLAEVVVALGVLASVLISIAGLIVLGNRQVGSARSSTAALAVASDVIERISHLGFEQTHAAFGCDASLSECLVLPEAVVLDEWTTRLRQQVPDSEIELRIESLDGPDLARALAIRVTVGVRWRDEQRSRLIELSTVRS